MNAIKEREVILAVLILGSSLIIFRRIGQLTAMKLLITGKWAAR